MWTLIETGAGESRRDLLADPPSPEYALVLDAILHTGDDERRDRPPRRLWHRTGRPS